MYLPNGSNGLKTVLSGCSVVEQISDRLLASSTSAAAAGFSDWRRSDWSASYLTNFTPPSSPLLPVVSASEGIASGSSHRVADSASRVKSNRRELATVKGRLLGQRLSVAGRSVDLSQSSCDGWRHKRRPSFRDELIDSSPMTFRFSGWRRVVSMIAGVMRHLCNSLKDDRQSPVNDDLDDGRTRIQSLVMDIV